MVLKAEKKEKAIPISFIVASEVIEFIPKAYALLIPSGYIM